MPNPKPFFSFHGTCKLMLSFAFFQILLGSIPQPLASSGDVLQRQVNELRIQVKRQPTAENYLQLAAALQELNFARPDGGRRIPEAERAYRKALDLIPHDVTRVMVLGNLGALLLGTERVHDALSALDEAAELVMSGAAGSDSAWRLGSVLFNRGKALTALGRLQEADNAYTQAGLAAYGFELSSYSKAMAAISELSTQQLDEAERVAAVLYLDAVGSVADLDDPPTWLLDLPRPPPSPAKPAWLQDQPVSKYVWLLFAVAKSMARQARAQDGRGQTPGLQDGTQGREDQIRGREDWTRERAWFWLRAGNVLMASDTYYQPENDAATVASLCAVFNTKFLADVAGAGYRDRTPIFVVGSPRSGSTLIEQALAAIPGVYAAGEDTALAPLVSELTQRLPQVLGGQSAGDLMEEIGRRYVERMLQAVPQSVVAAAEAGPAGGILHIVDKMLRNLYLLGYVRLVLPDACIIHAARHPMDAGLSCYEQPFGFAGMAWASDQRHIGHNLKLTWQLVDHWDDVMPDGVLTVYYEDMVANYREVMGEILDHCGLEWDEAIMNFHNVERPVHTASTAQVRKPLYSTSVGRWKEWRSELSELEDELGPLLARYEKQLQQRLDSRARRRNQGQGDKNGEDKGLQEEEEAAAQETNVMYESEEEHQGRDEL